MQGPEFLKESRSGFLGGNGNYQPSLRFDKFEDKGAVLY